MGSPRMTLISLMGCYCPSSLVLPLVGLGSSIDKVGFDLFSNGSLTNSLKSPLQIKASISSFN